MSLSYTLGGYAVISAHNNLHSLIPISVVQACVMFPCACLYMYISLWKAGQWVLFSITSYIITLLHLLIFVSPGEVTGGEKIYIYIYMHATANRRGTEDNFGELLSFHCVRSTTSLQMFFFWASGLLSVSPSVLQRGQAPSHDVLPHPETKISGAK